MRMKKSKCNTWTKDYLEVAKKSFHTTPARTAPAIGAAQSSTNDLSDNIWK